MGAGGDARPNFRAGTEAAAGWGPHGGGGGQPSLRGDGSGWRSLGGVAVMPMLGSRQRQARMALALTAVAVVVPSLVQVRASTRVGVREIIAVEFAGSGERLVVLAQGRRERLEVFRSLLGVRDNVYVAVYSVPLLLGVDLLPGVVRRAGLLLVLGTAAADVAENLALEKAFQVLLDDATRPGRADREAQRARQAAGVKFALLGPAVGMALGGVACGWQRPTGGLGRERR